MKLANLSAAFLLTGASCLAAQGGVVPGAVHNWVAGEDVTANNLWEDNGSQADRPWTLFGPVMHDVNGPGIITDAYSFDGIDDSALATAENRSGNHDTTFEIWFRPAGLPTDSTVRPLFEHGNGPRGVSLGLMTDTLVFAYGASPDFNSVTFDLDVGNDGLDNGHFIQAVGVIDDTANQMRLYVDGVLAAAANLGASNDFTSNDDLGLGINQSQGGGGQNAPGFTWGGAYAGDIAIVREYRFDFGAAEALQNYQHITVPEPGGLVMAVCCLVAVALGLRANSR